MPYATYRFNKIIAAETIRFIVTVAIVVYKGLKLVVYRMLTYGTQRNFFRRGKEGNIEFKFTDLFGADQTAILNEFMTGLGVKPNRA